MRIIGIKLKDGEDSVIKNLKPGMWYPFGEYVEPTAENDWQWEKNTSDEKRLNQLYKESSDTQLSDTFTISVCSIVGKNGAGKSTLLDLMFRIINNLAYSLLEKKQDITKYYFHSVSHHIGLDTHDPSDRELPLEEGNIISNEPGLYMPELGFGVRIEDDLLITKKGCEVLSEDIIKSVEDIERFYKQRH
jgi:AAA15 family ATPase/GTPase